MRQALRPLRETYGLTLVADFGPLALQAIQHKLVADGNARSYVNHLGGIVKRAFKWAAAQQLIPVAIYQALATVPGLKKDRTTAREPKPVQPVADAVVEATLPHVAEVVADMVRFQRLTGCRPGEVCSIRPCDVDTTAEVWTYRPESHKTEHHGRQRMIFIGPKAQDVLRPYLLREKTSYCFVPAESERKRLAEVHARRKTPLSCGNVPGSNCRRRPKRSPGDHYVKDAYNRAIQRAIDHANKKAAKQAKERAEDPPPSIPHWFPNQLRHAAATEVRRAYGLEAAQTVLGHAKADVTQVYAKRDAALAAEVMRKIG